MGEAVELKLLIAAVRRSVAIILAAIVVGGLIGVVLSSRGAGSYSASATLLVDSNAVTLPGAQPFTGDPERYVDDQMRILGGQDIATAVAGKVPGETGRGVERAVRLGHVTGSNAIVITATSPSAITAASIANDMVDVYVARRQDATTKVLDQQRSLFQGELADLQSRLKSLGSGTTNQSARETLLSQYNSILTQQATLDQAGATHDATAVIDRAQVPTAPTRSGRALPIGGGVIVGALLALAFAVLREVRNPHVVSVAQAELVIGVEAVATFGARRGLSSAAQGRRLAAVLAADAPTGRRRTIAVCAAGSASRSFEVASSLAAAFSLQGSAAALLDLTKKATEQLNSSRPVPVEYEPQAAPGRGELTASSALQPPWSTMTQPAPAQPAPAQPAPTALRHMHSGVTIYACAGRPSPDEVQACTDALPDSLDVVVVHVPPVLDDAIAAQVSRSADSTVLVVPVGSQPEADLRLSRDTLLRGGATNVHLVTAQRARIWAR